MINSSCGEVQEIFDSDTEHSQKTLIKVSNLKTRINDKLSKVKEFDEKMLNGLEQEDSERELSEILTREDELVEILTHVLTYILKNDAYCLCLT